MAGASGSPPSRRSCCSGVLEVFAASIWPRRGGALRQDLRRNGIAHRLTQRSSPTTTGKIERFHQTLRRELLDYAPVLLAAQAVLDDRVREFNASRPHQALGTKVLVVPADRFRPAPAEQRELLRSGW